jgi:RNA polymerase-associated protein RTF1
MSKRNTSDLEYDDEEDSDLDDAILSGVQPKKKRKVEEEGDDGYVAREEDFDDPYGDDWAKDDEDRQYLESLPELEKEQIIFARYQEREKLQRQKERLRRENKLKPRSTDDNKKRGSKRKSATEPMSRTSAEEKKQSSLSDIGAKRKAAKSMKEKTPVTPTSAKTDSIPDIGVDRNRRKSTKTSEPATSGASAVIPPQQLQRILIRRSQLESWFREPYFETLIRGCLVRVLVGSDQGRKVYRLAEVKDVGKAKSVYTFNNHPCQKSLILQLGASTKSFKMELISNNSEISQQEFLQWANEVTKAGDEGHIPTEQEIVKKEKDIQSIKDFVYDDAAINKKLEQNKVEPKNLATLSRNIALLYARVRTAQENNDTELANTLSEELEQLKQEEKEMRAKAASASKIDVSAINRKNRDRNVEITMRREREGAKQTSQESDPFARRSQNSNFFKFFDSPTTPKGNDAQNQTNTPFEAASPGGLLSPTKSPGSSLVDAHNFNIDIDIDLDQKPAPLFEEKKLPSLDSETKTTDNKKSLSLEDYKRRRGL